MDQRAIAILRDLAEENAERGAVGNRLGIDVRRGSGVGP